MMYDVGNFVATTTGVIGHQRATAGLAGMLEEMNYSEDQRQMMIDKIPTLALSSRPDGTTGFLNKPWLQHTVLLMEESLGWGWKVSVHPEDLGKLMDTWLGLLASGEPGEKEARLRRFDREYRWFLFRAVPHRDEQEKLIRWYGTNTDIGENRPLRRFMRDRCISKKASDRFRYCYRFIVVQFREVALRNGLRAAWSQPIVSKDNGVLGTLSRTANAESQLTFC